MKGNFHVRFWIGGGRSNPPADHTSGEENKYAAEERLQPIFLKSRNADILLLEETRS